jgi:lipopolysaccharide export system permease protein
MSIVTRHVTLELVKVFALTLATLATLMMLVFVAQEAVRQGLGLGPIARLVPYLLPNALTFSIPGALLLAACVVYGNMSASNEVLALKSAGVSPTVLYGPAVALGGVLSVVTVWLNDTAATWGLDGVQRVVVESVEEVAYGMLRAQRSYGTSRFAINVKRVDGRRLIQPTVTIAAMGDAPSITVTAEEAELRSNSREGTLSIFLTNGTIDVGDEVSLSFPDTIERVIPLHQSVDADDLGSGGRVSVWSVPAAMARQAERIARLEQSLAARSAYELALGDFDALGGDAWRKRHKDLADTRGQLLRLRVQPWRRWANGFSCLCFVLVGAPLAIRLRTADFISTFFICFFPILVLYYPFFIIGVEQVRSGAWPPYAVWLGNGVCLLAALHLMRRVNRY